MRRIRIGSVFSGIGGFELALVRAAAKRGVIIDVAWLCEIDPNAQKVLAHHFPKARIYDDITTLDPAEVEPVDIYVGGSPCQGFSMAGARTGLLHEESRLFVDYVRVLDGLAKRGLSFALWENVRGALSNRNEDGTFVFPQLIAALALGMDTPLDDADLLAGRFRADARWHAGLAGGGRRAVSWRVLDSRHFGVPQRRRRVFGCVALGDAPERRAFEVLLESRRLPGDPGSCSQEGERAAAPPRSSTEGGGLVPHTAPCLVARYAKGTDSDVSDAMIVEAFNWQQGDAEYALSEDAATLGTTSAPAILMTMREGKDGGGKGPLLAEEHSLTLATGNGQVLFEPFAFDTAQITSALNRTRVGPGEDVSTLAAGSVMHAATPYGVRRLTPVECERLQGFPDGWTGPAGSDGARYRALGNAVTVDTVAWIMERMLDALEVT